MMKHINGHDNLPRVAESIIIISYIRATLQFIWSSNLSYL